jgi:hypothetical protein
MAIEFKEDVWSTSFDVLVEEVSRHDIMKRQENSRIAEHFLLQLL